VSFKKKLTRPVTAAVTVKGVETSTTTMRTNAKEAG
jgi:hypothetical protein